MPKFSSVSTRDNVLPVPAPLASTSEVLAEPLLLWVLRGEVRAAVFEVAYRVPSGSALWVPRGAVVDVESGRSDVVLPISGIQLDTGGRPHLVPISEHVEAWLLSAFAGTLGYLDGGGARAHVERMLAPSAAQSARFPEMPRSREALELAQRVRRGPATLLPLGEEASGLGVSARTLQRHFAAETGLGFAEWVRATRMAIAADAIAAGRELEWVANHVGYSSVQSFSRSFTAETGIRPSRWMHGTRSSPPPSAETCPEETQARHPSPHALPSQRTWERINGAHVAVWVARGTARVTIGSRTHALARGDALVLPAGQVNRVEIDTASLVLPVGYRSGAQCGVGEILEPAHFGLEEEAQLVRAAALAYAPLNGEARNSAWGFETILRRSRTSQASSGQRLVATLASRVALDPGASDRTMGEWARILGRSEDELRRSLRTATGLTFAQWLRRSKMSRARAHLHRGQPASAVARTLGYRHLPAFTRAFRDVHGRPPAAL